MYPSPIILQKSFKHLVPEFIALKEMFPEFTTFLNKKGIKGPWDLSQLKQEDIEKAKQILGLTGADMFAHYLNRANQVIVDGIGNLTIGSANNQQEQPREPPSNDPQPRELPSNNRQQQPEIIANFTEEGHHLICSERAHDTEKKTIRYEISPEIGPEIVAKKKILKMTTKIFYNLNLNKCFTEVYYPDGAEPNYASDEVKSLIRMINQQIIKELMSDDFIRMHLIRELYLPLIINERGLFSPAEYALKLTVIIRYSLLEEETTGEFQWQYFHGIKPSMIMPALKYANPDPAIKGFFWKKDDESMHLFKMWVISEYLHLIRASEYYMQKSKKSHFPVTNTVIIRNKSGKFFSFTHRIEDGNPVIKPEAAVVFYNNVDINQRELDEKFNIRRIMSVWLEFRIGIKDKKTNKLLTDMLWTAGVKEPTDFSKFLEKSDEGYQSAVETWQQAFKDFDQTITQQILDKGKAEAKAPAAKKSILSIFCNYLLTNRIHQF